MTTRLQCPQCGSQHRLSVALTRHQLPNGPNNSGTFEVLLPRRSCGDCNHVWMDAKAEALISSAPLKSLILHTEGGIENEGFDALNIAETASPVAE